MDWPTGRFMRTALLPIDNIEQRHAITGVSPGPAAWPAANKAFARALLVDQPTIVKRLFINSGSTASGNFDIGIYDDRLNLVIAAGSTAQVGTLATQYVDIADTLLQVGRYYLVVVFDNATGTVYRFNSDIPILRAFGDFEMAAAFPLPSTLTPAALGTAWATHAGAEVLRCS